MNKKQKLVLLICLILVSGCKSLFQTNKAVETPKGEAKFLELYYINSEGERIERVKRKQSVQLVVISENMVGKKIDVDFSDEDILYKYKNKLLKKRLIKGLEVTADTFYIPLLAVSHFYNRKRR